MNEAAFLKFQQMLQGQGVPADDASWLASFWGELGDFMKAPVGLGAQPEGDEIRVYIYVPGNPEGLSYTLGELESMDNPVGEIAELIRTRLLKQ